MSTRRDQVGLTGIEGKRATPEDAFWLEMARSMAGESIKSVEDAAKQVIAVASLAQAVYFAALSFSTMRAAIGRFALAEQAILVLAFISPLICWVIALYFAIRVFKPEMYHTNLNSPDLAREMHHTVVAYKHQQLQRAYWFLVLGFVPLLVNVALSFFIVMPAT